MTQIIISWIVVFGLGVFAGMLINGRKISKVIKEAKEQMERSKRLIEENQKIISKL